jgi:two-component system, LytTR family, response regulator
MRIIIVEDEQPAIELIQNYLIGIDDLSIIGEYNDGFSAAVAINRDKPDLVLLDIQLPRLNGFEMLEVLDHSPQIIFTTAYDEFAIKAFERNATDYLLKPFSRDRFLTALEKAKEKFLSKDVGASSPVSMAEDFSSALPLNRVVVKDAKGINILSTNDIYYIEAQDDYVMFYCKQGRFMKKQTMKNLEGRLNRTQFVRIHRSYIVNALEISRIEPYEKETFLVILNSGDKIRASSSGYKTLREQLDF